MSIDWTQLARDVGSLDEDGSERGGSDFARRALELVIGEDSLREAVDLVVAHGRGTELTMNVLRHVCSRRACEMAYQSYRESYRESNGQPAANAVWLIKHIANPVAVEWIAEFLDDPNVAGWGVGALDQLLWSGRVYAADVEHLIVLAEKHALVNVREQAAFIREYLAGRARGHD